VGALQLNVEPAGAEVLVDGASVGKAPLAGEVFVEPGKRAIEARLDGYTTAKATVDIAAGASREVPLRLVKSEVSSEKAAGSSPANAASSNAVDAGKGRGHEPGESGPHKGLIIGGIATSAALVTAGIVFTVVSNANAADAKEQRAMFVAENVFDPCSMDASTARCEEFTSTLGATERFGNLAIWSFVLGGLVGAGTATYAIVAPRSKSASSMTLAPTVAANGGGLVIAGRW
jgi:hypothetical protein